MRENRRRAGGLTRCSNESTSLVEGDLNWYINQGVWSGLGEQNASKLSRSVVSIALSDGNTVLFSSSGIAVECGVNRARFLTSASLVRALNDNRSKNHDCLKIEVCHGRKAVTGFLEEYDLYLGIALVKITSSLNVEAVFLYHWCEFMPYCDVVSLGRGISGKLMAVTGKLTPDSSGSKEHLMFSSCKLSEVWEGGPLFDFSGLFVGMNLVPSMENSFFLPVNLIVERLQHFRTSQERTAFLARAKDLKTVRFGGLTDIPDPQPEGAPSKDHHGYLDALGYPRPTDSGMILVNTFEEHFGDIYCGGAWDQLSGRVRKKMHQIVVSLSSFNGDKRFFACSGIFIDWDGKCPDNEYQTILTSACLVRNPDYPHDDGNKIVEGLRIEVLLPRNKRREGTLIHYNVHYNVALVRVKESCGVSHAIFKRGSKKMESELVAAVGRCFKSGDLMASSGKLVPWSGPYDCKKLQDSTCRISKAGIGGPLVDEDGNFIGMNFYDPTVGTPFLSCDHIVDILDCLKKGTDAEIDSFRIDGDDSVCLNDWPVPEPYWCRPGDPKDDIDEDLHRILASGRQFRYSSGSIMILSR